MVAAAFALSLAASQAQTVYSKNVVGYVNVNLAAGYTAVANQLDYDGTGVNNTLQTVFGSSLPAPTTVWAWSPGAATFVSCTWTASKSGNVWTGDTTDVQAALQPGGAVFVQASSASTLTLVGTVIQGTNSITIAPGYNFASSTPPLGGDLVANLNYVPVVGDAVYLWDPVAQAYDVNSPYTYVAGKSGNVWTPSVPQVQVGESLFIYSTSGNIWTNILVIK